MRKLSPAMERVLRQVAAGQVTLVHIPSNAHSVRRWDAIGKNGKKVNRQYDALALRDIVAAPPGAVPYADRQAVLYGAGKTLLAELGPAGEHIYTDYGRAQEGTWMIRKETGEEEPYVLYRDGVGHSRYATPGAIYQVFREMCPYTGEDAEASLSR